MPDEAQIFDLSDREDSETRQQRKALAAHLRAAQKLVERNSPAKAWVLARAADSLFECTCRPVAALIYAHAPEKNTLQRGLCRHRICPHCQKMAKGRLGFELTELLTSELEHVRNGQFRLAMLTLPFKHNLRDRLRTLRTFFCGRTVKILDTDLEQRIHGAWECLVRSPLWRFFVQDYHRVIEIERNRRGFNLHAHTLIKFGPYRTEEREIDGELVTVKIPISQADLHAMFREGTLSELKAFKWWQRREKRLLRKRLKEEGIRFSEREWTQRQGAREAQFLSITAADIEQWFREAWCAATTAAAEKQGTDPKYRKSYILRYKEIRPGNAPGTALKRYRDKKTGKEVCEERPVAKVVQELIKYTTKGSAQGGVGKLKGKVGLMQYTPLELVEYIRGTKHMHLHQSSRGWKRLQNAFEEEKREIDSQADRDEGGERVTFVKQVADLQLAVDGWLGPDSLETAISNGLQFMDLWRVECKADRDFNRHNLRSMEDHLAKLLGDVDLLPQPFNLTKSEKVQVEKIKLRGFDRQDQFMAFEELARQAAIERCDARGEKPPPGVDWDPEVNEQYAAMRGGP